ncbi:Acetolactate synthase large subunit [Pseudonocardia sp. Ae406_Ps2]|uniref:thiamine pyrophosphate-binding protein n=1 Tax=unclassified Pseudonocardia TaxID=2619320 RepID=UPI00094AE6A9|nr:MULTISPECIES: thiamine pyrophosphate-binding protein [unclassified Pseudonocardia]OLL98541.1 Acetolactate synthase large subunit [Pseudonocardia sp. Ae331_Ps2]OLM03731.1 Acetolactate synthase large subunit [Pseudonocardia sp. Ae406_Ps2]OLM25290.1 Acetolactate synthase large subunit [Pseudonocardia sp. Ae706_Ps2]
MARPNGGDLLVALLRDHGVSCAFGVISVHNLPLVEALDAAGMFVPVRHEAAAVNAADGHARAGGGLGVAITSTGTGAGNAAGSLIEALAAGSRVLHITGQIDSGYLGQGRGVIHETPDQAGMLAAVSAPAATIRTADSAGPVLRDAVARTLSPPQGPSSVEWPIDLQYATQRDTRPVVVRPARPAPADPVSLDHAVELVRRSRRPLIWAGGGARDAGPQLQALVERLGAPLLTSNAGRGTVPETHELVVGNYGTAPAARDLVTGADLLIGIGSHYRSNETAQFTLPLPATAVQIDVDPRAIGRSYPATAGVVGDAAQVLEGLLERLGAHTAEPGWSDRARATRDAVRAAHRAAVAPYDVLCDAVRERLPDRSVIARDVTVPSSTWGNRLLSVVDPATNVFPLGGGIGQGLAMGIGAALARPDVPTLVMAGDGGLSVHLGEIATLAQTRPWLVLLVFNDGGYGVLRSMQDATGSPRAGVDLYTPDFATVARSVGLEHRLVTDVAAFDEALAKALATHEPSVVEVDLTAIGPMTVPFVPPVHVPGGDDE